MSNEFVQQHLATESGHLLQTPVVTIALAPALDKTDDCAKPQTVVPFIKTPYDPAKERSGPRIRRAKDSNKFRSLTVSTDREPWVHLHAANVHALGARGAIIFDYVTQWSRANKKGIAQLKVRDCHGGYWLACSYVHIEQQTGLDKKDAEAGIGACIDAGAFETTVMKYEGERCLHIRIAPADGARIVPWPLVVGDVTGEPPKSLRVLENDSKAHIGILVGDQSLHTDFPLQPPLGSTAIEETKPVDASPEATQSTVLPESKKTTGQMQESTPTPDAVKKPRKFSKLGRLFDQTRAKHYPTILTVPEPQQKIAYANLTRVKDRMLDAGYEYEQVERFVQFVAGEGWAMLRSSWTPEYNPQIHEKEKAPASPDLGWLAGSPKHGTGAHRLEIALEVWHMEDGGPWPTEPAPKKAVAEAAQSPAMPLADLDVNSHMPEPVQPAVEPAVVEPVDTRLSVADAWELIERSSALICQIEIWRGRIVAGVPTPALAEHLAKHPAYTAERLEIALALMSTQATQQPATPLVAVAGCVAVPEVVEPVTEAATCPPIVQVQQPTPAPCVDQCDGGYTWQDVLDGWAAEAARVTKEVAPKPTTPQPNMFQKVKPNYAQATPACV